MLARLNRIPWAKLGHAYGQASDTPGHLRALASRSPAARRRALRALSLSIIHQGTHWGGSAEATPFVVELALSPRVAERHRLLDFLAYLATGYEFRADHTFERLGGRAKDAPWAGSYQAIERALPQLRQLTRSPDARLRASAAMLLAWFPRHVARSARALLPLLADRGRHVASSAALALALCGRTTGAEAAATALRQALERARPGSSAALGCAVGLVWLRQAQGGRVLAELNAAVAEARSEPGHPFTERQGALAFSALLDLTPTLGPSSLAALRAGVKALEHDQHDAGLDRRGLVYTLLRQTFPVEPAPRRGRLREELGPFELEVLQLVHDEPVNWGDAAELLRERGLPTQREALESLLRPTRPQDLARWSWPVGGRRGWWPAWRYLVEAQLAGRPRAEVAAELAARLSRNELLDLYAQLVHVAYDLGQDTPALRAHVERALARQGLKAPGAQLERYEHLTRYGRFPSDSRWEDAPVVRRALLDVLLASGEPHPALPVALRFGVEFVPGLAEALDAVPEPGRAALLIQAAQSPVQPPPEGELGRMSAQHPRFRPGPWRYLGASTRPEWVRHLLSWVATLEPYEVPLELLLPYLAGLPEASFAVLLELERASPRLPLDLRGLELTPALARAEQLRAWVRRARWRRAGRPLPPEAVRLELRQWFRDGAWMSAHENAVLLLYPCPLCAQVYRELGLTDLGPRGRGGIELPESRADAGEERKGASVYHAWGGASADADGAWSADEEDPAIAEVVQRALAARGGQGDPGCVELRTLHRLARNIRAGFAP